MRVSPVLRPFCFFVLVLALVASALRTDAAQAKDDLKLRVQLIWGTNSEKPPGKGLKEVEAEIAKSLRNIFKWRNYFEVTRKSVEVAAKTSTPRVRLSEECEVEIENLGNSTIEVRLYGEGKYLTTARQSVAGGRTLSIAGNARNETAWFVVLKSE